jgi:single-strand DNA-binding protein
MLTPNDVRNFILLDGHLAKDPEVKTIDNGKKVANLSLATNEYFRKNDNEDFTKVTDFHDVTAWGKNADYAEKYLKKGARVQVYGKLRSNRKSEGKEKTYYNTFVEARVINGFDRVGGEEPATDSVLD